MLKVTANELVEELNNLKTLIAIEIANQDIEYIDERGFKALQSSIKVINLSNKLMIEQAETLDKINSKLDKLLNKH